MTTDTHPLPGAGGSYIRQPDGTLQLDEPAIAPEAPPEEALQAPIEEGAKAPRTRVKEA